MNQYFLYLICRACWCHRLSASAVSPAKSREMQLSFDCSPPTHNLIMGEKIPGSPLFFNVSRGESWWYLHVSATICESELAKTVGILWLP